MNIQHCDANCNDVTRKMYQVSGIYAIRRVLELVAYSDFVDGRARVHDRETKYHSKLTRCERKQ